MTITNEQTGIYTYSIRYSQDSSGHVFRTVAQLRDTEYFADGSFVPQHEVGSRTTEITECSTDYAEALEYIAALAESEALAALD